MPDSRFVKKEATNRQTEKSVQEETELFPIVGIGASAGGLKSIEILFDNMPVNIGAAYVVIQHLSPDHKSLMTELIARHTQMPVTLANEDLILEPNQIYVIPPGKELQCVGQSLAVSDLSGRPNRPIDLFFKSLAANEGIPTVGIVLSGTGSDGSSGIEAIHRSGGLTIAEMPSTAKFDGMPSSAIRTGRVQHVLQANEIPAAIDEYLKGVAQRLTVDDSQLAGVDRIFKLLEKRYRIDFAQYKPRTILRRIERRQALGQFQSIKHFADNLESEDSDLDELFHDLLIGVTKFFRDLPAFEVLEEHVSSSVETLPIDETFRVWVIGCATGEEAYSLTMMLSDILERLGRPPLLKVFATDIDEKSLEIASRGEFDSDAMEFVTLERQKKYFDVLRNGRFRVSQRLRQHLVFSRHNAIEDPPFTKMHLVTCRNMLIYLANSGQFATLASAHFALRQSGLIFLGTSETLGELSDEFRPLDQRWRIYKKVGERRDLLAQVKRANDKYSPTSSHFNPLNADRTVPLTARSLIELYDAVVRSTMTVGLLLDEKQNLLHAIGDVASILKRASNRFRGTIGDVLDAPARTTVIAALMLAWKDPGTEFIVEQVQPNSDNEEYVTARVLALQVNDTNVGWIVRFDPSEKTPVKTVRITQDQSEAYELLESELQFTKESLNASVEELESGNEELQATNEEMIASNEELQSTNEELQSVNEELHSVNEELHRKITELEETTADLEAFLASSYIGTIFLDREQRIRKFTKATLRHFDLIDHDIGRSLGNFTNRMQLPNLSDLIRNVVESGKSIASETVDAYGEELRVVIDPFRTGNVISGAVVTILRESSEFDEAVRVNATRIGLWEWPDTTKDEMWWSPTCYQLLGLDPKSPSLFSRWKQLIHADDLSQLARIGTNSCKFIELGRLSFRMLNANNEYRILEFRNVSGIHQTQVVRSMVGTVIDTSISQDDRVGAQQEED